MAETVHFQWVDHFVFGSRMSDPLTHFCVIDGVTSRGAESGAFKTQPALNPPDFLLPASFFAPLSGL